MSKTQKNILVCVLILCFGLVVVGCGGEKPVEPAKQDQQSNEPVKAEKPKMLVWGSASLGSQGYVIIEALASTANKAKVSFRNSSISTSGGAENIALLDQGEIQLGQATSSDLFNAFHGQKPYDKKIEFSQIFAYGAWPLATVVSDKSTIKNFEDLKGKKLHVGPASGAAVPMMKQILEEYGLSNDVTLVFGSWQEAANAMKLGQVDASCLNHMAGKLIPSAFQELAITEPFRPVIFDKAKLEAVSGNNEGIAVGTINKGIFPSYREDTIAPAITGVLTSRPDLDADVVYELTKTLLEKTDDIQKIGPELQLVTKDWAVQGLVPGYPVHPGAARYFKEIGLWKDTMVEGK